MTLTAALAVSVLKSSLSKYDWLSIASITEVSIIYSLQAGIILAVSYCLLHVSSLSCHYFPFIFHHSLLLSLESDFLLVGAFEYEASSVFRGTTYQRHSSKRGDVPIVLLWFSVFTK